MITDDEVMRLFEQADPARTDQEHNNTPDATGYLAALRTRSNNVTILDTTETPPEPPDRRRWLIMGAAAAAVTIFVVGGLVLLTGDDDGEPDVAATVPPTVAPTTLAPPVENAIGLATDFLAAFASGDPAVVEALQADGFEMRYAWLSEAFGGPLAPHEWLGASYQAANGTTYVEPNCSVSGLDQGLAIVECETVMQLAAHRLTNTSGVPAIVTLRVADDGVVGMESAYGTNLGLLAFADWTEANRPGVPRGDNAVVQTVEEIIEVAQGEAQLAADWVTFAIDAVEAAFADHSAGNVDELLARFAPGIGPWGPTSDDTAAIISASSAFGSRQEPSNCAPAGISENALTIICDVVNQSERSGVELTGEYGHRVAADGIITWSTNTVNWEPMHEFNRAFKQWLGDTHPDVHGQIEWIVVSGTSSIASADDYPVVVPYYDEFLAQSETYPLRG